MDNLFRSPPSTEEQQLDPWTLVADHQGYLSVPKPELGDGDEGIDDGTFGALGLFLVLSERLPAEQALTAADGWGGDSYAAFERDGVSCVRIHYRGDTPDDLVEMKTAMETWIAKLPKGPARVSRDGTTVNFESCDPGANAPKVAAGKSMDALAFALSRTYLSVSLVESGLDVPTGRCAADRLVREFSIAELNEPDRGPGAGAADHRALPQARLTGARTGHSRDLLVYSRPMGHNGHTTTSLSFVRSPCSTVVPRPSRARWGRRSSRRGRRRR